MKSTRSDKSAPSGEVPWPPGAPYVVRGPLKPPRGGLETVRDGSYFKRRAPPRNQLQQSVTRTLSESGRGCLRSTAGTITTKETVRAKVIGFSSHVKPIKCIGRAETSRGSDSAAYLSTTQRRMNIFTERECDRHGEDFRRSRRAGEDLIEAMISLAVCAEVPSLDGIGYRHASVNPQHCGSWNQVIAARYLRREEPNVLLIIQEIRKNFLPGDFSFLSGCL